MHQEHFIRASEILGQNSATTDVQLHKPWRVKAVFISDVHLGYKGCMAEDLVGFLMHVESDLFYLVGDFVDGWSLNVTRMTQVGRLFKAKNPAVTGLKLPQGHADVTQKLQRHTRRGAHIFYIPGNHDEFWRPVLPHIPDVPEQAIDIYLDFMAASQEFAGRTLSELKDFNVLHDAFREMYELGKIHILRNVIHKTVDDRRLLVSHGDEFDFLIKNYHSLGILGTKLRDQLFATSEWLSRNDEYWLIRMATRNLLGLSNEFSLADYIKKYKSAEDRAMPTLAMEYIRNRNDVICHRRQTQEEWRAEPLIDGYVGGHNHIPALEESDTIAYYNCGDWVGSGTALVEHLDGRMELVKWDKEKGIVPFYESSRPDRRMQVSQSVPLAAE